MPNDLISIITPVFNVENYIERCLNGILNQSYTNWELILVNDGSTDKSGEICRSFANKDNRIIYLEQTNQGQAVARNKALDNVKGKYICFVDSDDWIDKDYLKFLYEAIIKNDSEIAICAHSIVRDNRNNRVELVPTGKSIIRKDEFKTKLIKDEIHSYLWDKIFMSNIFDNIRFTPGICFEDYSVYHKILPILKTDVPVVNIPLYFYYQRDNSTIHLKKVKNILDNFNSAKSRLELFYLKNEEKPHVFKRILLAYLLLFNLDDCEKKIFSDCKQYIKSINHLIYIDALKLLTIKYQIIFLSAFHFPRLYKLLFKFYITLIDFIYRRFCLNVNRNKKSII